MPYVASGRMMMLGIECKQNLGIAGANGSAGTVGLVNAGVGQADVVENRLQLTPGNLLMEHGFDLVAKARRLFDSQTGTGANMQAQQAGIHLRKKVLSQEHEQPQREHAKDQEAKHKNATMLERGLEQLLVAPAEVLKPAFEAALEAAEERTGRFGAMLVPAHDEHDQRWNERPREQIAGQHGEAYGLCQRHEQKFCHA